MKSTILFTIFLASIATSNAFHSRFIGRSCAQKLSCPPAFTNSLGRTVNRVTSPLLTPLGLRNPFRRNKIEEEQPDTAVAVMDAPVLPVDKANDEEGCVVPEEEEELSDTQKLMKQVKDAGLAGVISYALWEVSLPWNDNFVSSLPFL